MLALSLLVSSCGRGAGDSTGPSSSTLRAVAGASITDTVLAKPLQALVIEVRPNGQPAPGLIVRFESLPSADTTRRFDEAVTVSKISQNYFSTFASDTTNASGRASVLIQLGTVAGEARLLVTCPELGLADTVRFTVLPGSAARLSLTVRDTAVIAGSSYAVGAFASDRFGNRRSDAVSYSPGPNTTSVDGSGRVTVGTTIGRGAIAVRAGSALDSARFTVVPDGTLALLHFSDQGVGSIATSKVDGSGLKLLIAATTPAYPNISPTETLIAYQQYESTGTVTYLVDGAGVRRPLVNPSLMRWSALPHFSGDGQYVFFAGLALEDTSVAVWRVRTNGTGLERVSVQTEATYAMNNIGVSPDGSRIAYAEGYGFAILNLATGVKTRVNDYYSTFLEFSPDGSRIAYLTGGSIKIVNVDGTSSVTLASGQVSGDAGLAWLPDGKWLVVRSYYGPIIVNVSTNEVIPLPFRNYYQMSARR
jgi:hypothetical protein